MRWPRRRKRWSFFTHSPGPWCNPGTPVLNTAEGDATLGKVVKIIAVAPTETNYGAQGCWRVKCIETPS